MSPLTWDNGGNQPFTTHVHPRRSSPATRPPTAPAAATPGSLKMCNR
ncbi:hypothetical protein [Actinomyces lilanjuaniae]|nr:hypothetical protein [Actinomyces lilanjuaniae]